MIPTLRRSTPSCNSALLTTAWRTVSFRSTSLHSTPSCQIRTPSMPEPTRRLWYSMSASLIRTSCLMRDGSLGRIALVASSQRDRWSLHRGRRRFCRVSRANGARCTPSRYPARRDLLCVIWTCGRTVPRHGVSDRQ